MWETDINGMSVDISMNYSVSEEVNNQYEFSTKFSIEMNKYLHNINSSKQILD